MSTKKKLLEAAAGNAGGEATYVDDVFSTYLYAGNGSTQTITNGIDLDGEGGLVWIKPRSAAGDHNLMDTERGANYYFNTNGTAASAFNSIPLTPFNSDGFDLNVPYADWNASGRDYASWTFRKQPGFFDVVTYTGDAVVGRTVAHNLGSVPGMIIVKCTSESGQNWMVYHRSLGATKAVYLNLTNSQITQSAFWNNTAPTSTHFTVANSSVNNGDAKEYIAYLFAHDAQEFGTDSDESIIKCGSYTGTGSNPNNIDLGFEPQWLLLKANASASWLIFDNMRGVVTGGDDQFLSPNLSSAEATSSFIDFNSTGFNAAPGQNSNGTQYLYMAIRRPHKPAEEFAATDLFDVTAYTGAGAGTSVTTGFPVDMTLVKGRDTANTPVEVWNRLRGPKEYLLADSIYAAGAFGSNQWAVDNMTGYTWATGDGWASGSGVTYVTWNFKRAPGFFDVVAYDGTGVSPMNVPHNLGVTPELIITKARTSGDTNGWWTYPLFVPDAYGNTGYVRLNTSTQYAITGWTGPMATSTAITIPSDLFSNTSGVSYVAYLFASVDGISKLGLYTGTGSNVDVDCGFSAGARFILIKRSDATGDWYVWDSVRGIVAGNDPYLLLNSDAAEVTNTDYIDPLSSGFTVTSSAPAALNASGGTYIFYAIA
jgi:hypothetical protein